MERLREVHRQNRERDRWTAASWAALAGAVISLEALHRATGLSRKRIMIQSLVGLMLTTAAVWLVCAILNIGFGVDGSPIWRMFGYDGQAAERVRYCARLEENLSAQPLDYQREFKARNHSGCF